MGERLREDWPASGELFGSRYQLTMANMWVYGITDGITQEVNGAADELRPR